MQKNQNQPHKMEEFGIYPIMVFITHRSLTKLELSLTAAPSLMEGQVTKSHIYGSGFNQPANKSFDKISTRSCSNGGHWEDVFPDTYCWWAQKSAKVFVVKGWWHVKRNNWPQDVCACI